MFTAAAAMALAAALISLVRGGQFYYGDQQMPSGTGGKKLSSSRQGRIIR